MHEYGAAAPDDPWAGVVIKLNEEIIQAIGAREPVAWGPTNEALCDENLLRARAMVEAFDRDARSEEHKSELQSRGLIRMPSSA